MAIDASCEQGGVSTGRFGVFVVADFGAHVSGGLHATAGSASPGVLPYTAAHVGPHVRVCIAKTERGRALSAMMMMRAWQVRDGGGGTRGGGGGWAQKLFGRR